MNQSIKKEEESVNSPERNAKDKDKDKSDDPLRETKNKLTREPFFKVVKKNVSRGKKSSLPSSPTSSSSTSLNEQEHIKALSSSSSLNHPLPLSSKRTRESAKAKTASTKIPSTKTKSFSKNEIIRDRDLLTQQELSTLITPKEQELLEQFDMDVTFGPCIGISRYYRYKRAISLGLESDSLIRAAPLIEKWKDHPTVMKDLWIDRI